MPKESESGNGFTTDDTTPSDSPSVSIIRLAQHQRELCEAFDRVAPLLREIKQTDKLFVYEKLIEICLDGEAAFAECRQALNALAEIEMFMNPASRKKK